MRATLEAMGVALKVLLVCAALVAPAAVEASARDERACADRAAEPDARIAACTKAIQGSSVSDGDRRAWAHMNRGDAHVSNSDLDGAIKDFDRAIWLNPLGFVDVAHYRRGAAYEQKGDYERAMRDYDEAAKRKRNWASYQNARCWIRAVSNRDLVTALDLCNLALTLAPKSAETLDSRGFVYFRLGDMAKARADYSAALALHPNSASSLFMRGVVRRRSGDTAGGEGDIAAALAIDANVQAAYGRYGVTP